MKYYVYGMYWTYPGNKEWYLTIAVLFMSVFLLTKLVSNARGFVVGTLFKIGCYIGLTIFVGIVLEENMDLNVVRYAWKFDTKNVWTRYLIL